MDVGYEDILKAVLDEPDNVGLRLILADWQEEYGGENGALHAELIRLQCESDKYNPRVSELIDLLKRTNLLGHIASRDEFHTFRVERGFIEVVNCTAEEWYDEGDKCVARSPIREVRLSNRPDLAQDKWWRLSQRRQQNYEMAKERVKYEHRHEQDIDPTNWTIFILLRTCWPSVDRWEIPTEEQEQFRRNQERARSQGIPYRFIAESLEIVQSGLDFLNPPMQEFQMASGVLYSGAIIRDGNGSPIGMVGAGGTIGSLNADGISPVQGLERLVRTVPMNILQEASSRIRESLSSDAESDAGVNRQALQEIRSISSMIDQELEEMNERQRQINMAVEQRRFADTVNRSMNDLVSRLERHYRRGQYDPVMDGDPTVAPPQGIIHAEQNVEEYQSRVIPLIGAGPTQSGDIYCLINENVWQSRYELARQRVMLQQGHSNSPTANNVPPGANVRLVQNIGDTEWTVMINDNPVGTVPNGDVAVNI